MRSSSSTRSRRRRTGSRPHRCLQGTHDGTLASPEGDVPADRPQARAGATCSPASGRASVEEHLYFDPDGHHHAARAHARGCRAPPRSPETVPRIGREGPKRVLRGPWVNQQEGSSSTTRSVIRRTGSPTRKGTVDAAKRAARAKAEHRNSRRRPGRRPRRRCRGSNRAAGRRSASPSPPAAARAPLETTALPINMRPPATNAPRRRRGALTHTAAADGSEQRHAYRQPEDRRTSRIFGRQFITAGT